MAMLSGPHGSREENNTEENTHRRCHERGSNHVATMFLVFSTLPGCKLNIALFAVNVGLWLGSQDACDGLRERLWSACSVRRAGGWLVTVNRVVGKDIIIGGCGLSWSSRNAHSSVLGRFLDSECWAHVENMQGDERERVPSSKPPQRCAKLITRGEPPANREPLTTSNGYLHCPRYPQSYGSTAC
ncbi:uncharacterized protein K460DRAFT_428560 [Cucurbitaria berberidis CBS 394.84]|uniref:Uncharacterized protein n=1 Tax=Cucurbitaria berberidis CBS 394.84 TaxID=1168544 RepID=A0A9P4LCF9_9PLEO|nr:uncharacterized protein K460DRAFT_428560 [Cucurbitaria berberidis CBS 394.84]KAF1849124.1 hypothetical protein K460DRAFT_428560 [Cucurbitaria berberidis CBS 394.84]